MSRERVAKIELDKAYDRLLKNSDLTKELIDLLIKEGVKVDEIFNNVKNVLSINGKKVDTKTLAKMGIGTNFASDLLGGQNFWRAAAGSGIDAGTMFLSSTKLIPGVGQITLALDVLNLMDKILLNTGAFDIRNKAQKLYDKITNTTSDLPDISDGILKITMPDGTVYARPLIPNSNSRLFGEDENDVLFGGSGDDFFIGRYGDDLFIGGDGFDTYHADAGDIIKDSDGKGGVYWEGKLTGGIYDEEKDVYRGSDGWTTYKMVGENLHIIRGASKPLIVENFNKEGNDLGIVLMDKEDIIVTISDNSAGEGDTSGQSMKFNVSLNRTLKKDEKLTLMVNNQEIVFKEEDSQKSYEHAWHGNKIEEEDRKFEVSASVLTSGTSENMKVRDIQSGHGTIKDDDRDANTRKKHINHKFNNKFVLLNL